MTNYDRIKAMSVEEMSDMLVVELKNIIPFSLWQSLPTNSTYIAKSQAIQDVIQWLEQEVE